MESSLTVLDLPKDHLIVSIGLDCSVASLRLDSDFGQN